MTIFEQILAGLQTKFPGADTATLTRIATKKAEGVTDETKVNSIVEGISFQDVMQNYGDFRAGQAQTSSIANYEKKHGLKDGKPIENPKPEPPKPEPKPDEKPDIAKLIADGIAAGIKPFSDKLAAFEAKEAQAQRMAQITSVAKKYGISEKQAVRYAIPADADLDTYFKDVKQELANDGYQQVKAPETAEQQLERETSEFAKMIENDTKQIVEQQNK